MSYMSRNNNKLKHNQKLTQDKYGYFPIWFQPENPENDTIIKISDKNQIKIKNLTETLNEDHPYSKNNLLNEDKKEQIDSGHKKIKNISDNVNKILNSVGKIVTKIKNSQEKLSDINMKALLNTKEKVVKSEKLQEPNNLVKKKENEYNKLFDIKHNRKKAYHYRFLSNYYRRQLNKALMDFNPLRHLENIKTLRKENPEINEEFNKKTKIINEELFNITSPNFFRKTSYNYKNTPRIATKTNINFFPNNNKNISNNTNNKFSLPKMANFTSIGFHPIYKCYATETDIPKKIKTSSKKNNLSLYGFNSNFSSKKNKLRKFPDKETRKIELELMEDVCKNMMNSINKVESEQNDFYNTYAKLNIDERKKIKDNILKDKIDNEKILLQIKNNNLMRNVNNDMDIKRKKINDDIKDYGNQINYIKDEIISNIEQQESLEHIFINNEINSNTN